ncbi:restriction endonuclease subunit S [Algoriphagus sp.]|uniref:restriction endonuclease subunit S n=1 Tax=Algoriphagus sp. TaxID=1872435 RepID=UPI003F72573E
MIEEIKLKDIACSISSGLTPSRSNRKFWDNSEIFWLKTVQLGERNIYKTSEKISLQALLGTSIRLNPIGTISMAMYGEGRTRGNVSILKSEMTTNQACCNIVLDEKKADIEFVYYFLKTQYGNLRALSSGVRKNLNSNDIKEFKILLPKSISTQQKIASVLSALDDKIELNNRINAELEAMAKLIYECWFVQFDFPYDFRQGKPADETSFVEDIKPYKSSGGKMVWSKELKRGIPLGWEVKPVDYWIEKDKNGDWGKEEIEGNYDLRVSCIRGADINGLNGKGEIKSPVRFILEKNIHKLLEPGDLVIEISGGSPIQSTGRLGYIINETLERFNEPIICSNFCKAITLKDESIQFNFIYEWRRLYDAGVFFGYEGKTSGIKNFLFESFVSKHKIVIPPDFLVEKFYEKAISIHSKIQSNLIQNQELASLRDWLLPMLMNGQVTVADVEVMVEEKLGMVAEERAKYSNESNRY